MAKENKIGLLVGLAFIIAVGLLFSDYASTNNEPPQASLPTLAGTAVRSSLGESRPAGDVPPPANVRVPNNITPNAQVPTAGELADRARKPAAPAVPPIAPTMTGPGESTPPTAFAAGPNDPNAVPPSMNQALLDAAARAGQALGAPTEHESTPAAPRRSAATAGRTVVAESGDSLGDLAEKAYGTSTRATRAALLAANPALKANPDRIIAGQAYNVGGAVPDGAVAQRSTPSKATDSAGYYWVRQGDTLRSIALRQLGTKKAVPAILALNPDIQIDTPLRLNMRLRLP